jgi:hypothetical protein
MYEHYKDRLLTGGEFAMRVMQSGAVVVIAVAVALTVGVLGYHFFNKLPWIDALLDASMILGGMGPVNPIRTAPAKLFSSFYALFSGLFFIAATGILLAPFLHRLLHKFHLEKTKGIDE